MKCGKTCYQTRAVAKRVLKLLNKDKGFKLKSVYYCYDCNMWHTTSEEREVSKIIDRRHKEKYLNKLDKAFKKYTK